MCSVIAGCMNNGRFYITHSQGAMEARLWLVTPHLLCGQLFVSGSKRVSCPGCQFGEILFLAVKFTRNIFKINLNGYNFSSAPTVRVSVTD